MPESLYRAPDLAVGPVYGIELIESLPLGKGSMQQAMPSRSDLEQVRRVNERVVAGYEVLLAHYREKCEEVIRLKGRIRDNQREYDRDMRDAAREGMEEA